MEKLLTIGIAAYNVEPYLEKLLDSVTASGVMDRIEVLVINDGSTDKTPEIAEKYAKQFPESIRLISKENGGYGSTFNRGFKEACGKYYRSLDGDDWINSGSLKKLTEKLSGIDADMILCDCTWYHENGTPERISFPQFTPDTVYSAEEVCDKLDRVTIHSIIYKTRILKENGIRLEDRCFYVDLEYDVYPLLYVNTVYYFDEPLYCYRVGYEGQSVSKESRKKHAGHSLTVAENLLEFFTRNKGKLTGPKRKYISVKIAEHCQWYIESLLFFAPSVKIQQEIERFDKSIRQNAKEIYDLLGNGQSKFNSYMKCMRFSGYYAYWIIKLLKKIKDVFTG